jgi:glycosyltransferase involved in cell wall biosynthesis
MKILITSGIFPPDIGGPASYVPKIAKELSNKGHKVNVICLSEKKYDDSKFNFNVIRIDREIFFPLRVFKTIFKIYSSAKKADLIFANTLIFESSIAALLSGKPIVHKIVGDYAWERARNKNWFNGTIDEYQTSKKNFKLKFLDFYFKYFLRFSKVIITPSYYLKNIVLGWDKSLDVKTIYNAIEFPSKYVKENNDSFSKLITVSRLVSWKRIDEIILAIKDLEGYTLDIIGEGPEEHFLKDLVKKHHLENRITFLGHLDKENVFKRMAQSDVFILNSSYEGLPHVIVEAMSAKLPVICADVGGCSEIVIHKETGFLTEAITDISRFLLNYSNINNRKIITENAYEFVSIKFNYQTMISKTIKKLIDAV